jgi:cyclophilin family peptidyl-prolyl cis-trans isomerase
MHWYQNFKLTNITLGEYGVGKLSKKKLHYLGSKVHRIVEDFVIQGGDIIT